MADEEKMYTKGEMELLLATHEVKTMQKLMMEHFDAHIKEDDAHFDTLYRTDKEIISKLDSMPQKFLECSNRVKDEIFAKASTIYTAQKDFEIFRTKVVTWVSAAVVVGVIVAELINIFMKNGVPTP